MKFKIPIYFFLFLFITSLNYSQIKDTIKVDFGSITSTGEWNNFNDVNGAGEITMLKNSRNLYTGMGINIYDRFNGINTAGTQTPDSSLGFPPTATQDSYFGNTVLFGGLVEPTGGMLFTGLDTTKEYTFEIFASRTGVGDNRETQYRFDGLTLDSVLLNPSNNTSNIVSLTMKPKADGTIDLIVSPGPNNNNGSGFFYLGALTIIYEPGDVLPPALTLTAPNGGEELTGGTNYNIAWAPINLLENIVVSYSTNNGASWTEIATVDSAQTSLSWLVPDISSTACLVQAVSGTASDQSDSVFTILGSPSVVNDTIMIDFGSIVSTEPWNNFTSTEGSGEILYLKNSNNVYTSMACSIYDRFNNINLNGTTNPDPNLGLPSSATNDSYYGNIAEWLGLVEPTAGMLFTGLDTSKQYTFEIFASRMGVSDNRETKYKFIGNITDSIYLNSANNEANQTTITIQPASDGSIDLMVSPGENNNNTYNFYYIGALRMIYEHEDVLPPSVTVTSPNGGEELGKGTSQNITWTSTDVKDVKIEFSPNGGTTWDSLGTVNGAAGTFEWILPDIYTDSALVKISAVGNSEISDISDNFFKIGDYISVVPDTILIDFGSIVSAEPWNNFESAEGSGTISSLKNSRNEFTGIGCNIYDRFNNINLNGTTNPDPNLGLPPTATNDSYYGNIAVWQGLVEPTAAMLFTGLDTSKQYTFEIFSSRMGVSDNRETKYKFVGNITDSIYLDPANNETKQVSITLLPASDGSIDLMLSPGENNNNTYNFFYIGALRMVYQEKGVSEPSVKVTSPNGGEEWIKGSAQNITWTSNSINDVKIEFSADNGATWDSVGSAVATLRKFEWIVPTINTDSALVRISAVENPAVSDVSDNVFRIDDPISGEFRPLIVVLGSSTAAGVGASSSDSSWVGRYRNYIKALDTRAYLVNLAVGGFTSYDVMPSGYVPPAGRPTPKTENNVTKALTYKPWAIIVNLPSNDAANNYSTGEQLYNMNAITQAATNEQVPIWVTTTQPRNFSQAQRDNLKQMRDYILSIYRDHAISIFDTLANEDGTIKTIYNSGDGVHVNNDGHKVIYDKVVDAHVWESITDVTKEEQQVPVSFAISQNYPNPFNPTTTIDFSLPVSSEIDVKIYDVLGREVAVIASGNYSPGYYNFVWDASNLASGMYIYRMIAHGSDNSDFVKTMKMMLVK